MKKFVLKFIIISLPVLFGLGLMEIMLRNIPNDYWYKKDYLDKHAAEIETLILGNSLSYYGLNPEFFSVNTFNASYVSQTLNYNAEILNKYKKEFKNLKTLILPVSYMTFFADIENDLENWRVKNYVIYYKIHKSKTLKYHFEVLSNRFDVNIKRLISYYLHGESAITTSNSGWGRVNIATNTQYLNQTGLEAAKRNTVKNLYSAENQKTLNNNLLILKTLVAWCKENHVKVLFFSPPTYKSFYENLNPKQMNLTLSLIKNICAQYNNCTYVNLLRDQNFDEGDFFDGDHLSGKGAKKLSQMINARNNRMMQD